jgi:hypothetical protein
MPLRSCFNLLTIHIGSVATASVVVISTSIINITDTSTPVPAATSSTVGTEKASGTSATASASKSAGAAGPLSAVDIGGVAAMLFGAAVWLA